MKTIQRVITTKAEIRLAELVGFQGKYVESLVTKAKKHFDGDTVKELLGDSDRREAARVKAYFGMSMKTYQMLQIKARRILQDFDTGHSMGCTKTLFVGGHSFAYRSTCERYAGSCRYTPTHGALAIYLTVKELKLITRIEGIWTLPVSAEHHQARWLEHSGIKAHYKIEWIHGFLIGTSHGNTLIECIQSDVQKRRERVRSAENDNKFVGFDHARATGACAAGLKAFADRHGLDLTLGYRVGYLKSLNDSVAISYLGRI